jgi:hypothetical protein
MSGSSPGTFPSSLGGHSRTLTDARALYAGRVDWFTVLLVGFAAFAGALGASAQKRDRVRDIPQVFMRSPFRLVALWMGVSALYVIQYLVRH